MKLRNLANKFLLVVLLAVLTLGNYAFNLTVIGVATPTNLATAAAVNSKTYYLDQFNDNKPTNETLYEALGITVYNDYLTALSATQNLNEVVIAVVDTGLDYTNSIFQNRILSDYAVDFSHGIPTTTSNTWYVDENGHGTHVAGIIADITPANVKILPIKIFDGINNSVSDGYAFENAIRWLCMLKSGTSEPLLENGLNTSYHFNRNRDKIENLVAVNLSLGTDGFRCGNVIDMSTFKSEKTDYQKIIDNLLKNNILPIAAAGNRASGENNSEAYYSLPGACDGVLEVSAYDNTINQYALANFSYYNDCVGLAAPGAEIWSVCSSSIVELLSQSRRETHFNYTIYQYSGASTSWYIKQDLAGNYYLRESGTSMATPFVTACYALLMSDSSKLTYNNEEEKEKALQSKSTAEKFGLASWDAAGDDADFMNVVHKALLAAAATDGEHSDTGYDIMFGYGTVNVKGFVPNDETGTVRTLNNIGYETQPSANYQNASFGGSLTNSTDTDWMAVCIVLAVGILLIWAVNRLKAYAIRRKTNDDEQQ